MKYLLLTLLLLSCNGKKLEENEINDIVSKFNMVCVDVGHLARCENREVICYTEYRTGTSCKFKKVDK